jgi:predicted CXXCH cytochrome family protein
LQETLPGVEMMPLALVALLVAQAAASPAKEPPEAELETCLACHEDPELTIAFANGSTRSLTVNREAFAASVHGKRLRCTDCHPGLDEIPHPERRWADADEFARGQRESCKSCHFANYTRYMDSVHHRVLESGEGPAPSCVDCHDAHAVTPPGNPRTRISDTCSACHSDVADTYAGSVHGRALAGPQAGDVPVCTDCHRSHDIADPRDAAFLLRTPELCGSCHADAERMKRYGLSTAVLETYLADFHGMTATLARGTAQGQGRVTAVCVDCHGHHDITKVAEPGSRVLKENLVRTCQQCHADASASFPAAWLSHFEPSWQKAPLVYSIKLFYKIFIPFVIGGLVLQILLHLWRVVVNR